MCYFLVKRFLVWGELVNIAFNKINPVRVGIVEHGRKHRC